MLWIYNNIDYRDTSSEDGISPCGEIGIIYYLSFNVVNKDVDVISM